MKIKITVLLFAVSLCVAESSCKKEKTVVEKTAVAVRIQQTKECIFTDAVSTQGVVEAVDQAVLSANIPGRLELLNVREGDTVKAGQLLFRTDEENLKNTCSLAEETLRLAVTRAATREADLRLAVLNLAKAKSDYDRNAKLYLSKAVSSDLFESYELKYHQAELAVQKAKSAQDAANAEVGMAQAGLKIARKKEADAKVVAPYDGVITAKMRHAGEFCGAGTPVLKIEKPQKKRITAVISGLHFPEVKRGETMVAVSLRGKKLCIVPVTIVPDVIDPVSRTFEIKADLPDSVRIPSGMLCSVSIITGQRKGAGLPENSVLFRQNGTFAVYEAKDGKACEVSVQTGTTQNGMTEILNPESTAGKDIIVSGQYFVEDGSPVRILE